MTEQEVYEFVNNLLEKFEGDRVTTNYKLIELEYGLESSVNE